MRIAVVGAGVSGLVAAHLLAPEHEVTVFEAQAYAGGHTNTVRVDTPHETHWVDTGFIVFNDRNYPRFERLLDRLGVRGQPSDMSFAVTDEAGDFEYASTSPNGLFAKRAHLATPWFHRMVADLLRFQREARALLASDGDGPSLGHFLEERRYSRAFVDRLIVPQAAAVWSADPRQMWSFPARFLIEFFANHGMLGLPRPPEVADGRRRLAPLRRGADRAVARPPAPLHARSRRSPATTTTSRSRRAASDAERFDHVVLATHSDQALKLLADPSPREHELLGAIPYQANEAVLHTDATHAPAPPPRVGELELPPARGAHRQADGHLPHEPPADARRRARVLRDAQPHARRSTPARSSARSRTRTRLHRRRPGRPGAPRGDQRREPHALLRRLLGLGLPRGRRRQRRARRAAARGSERCEPQRDLRGHDPPPPLRGARSTSSATGSRWPTSTSTSSRRCSEAASPARAPASSASAAATTSATRRRRSTRPSATLVEERLGSAPQGPIRLLTHLRTFGHCFNPVSFYYCFAPDGEQLEAIVAEVTNTPWGERHAYVLDGRRADPPRRLRQGAARLALHGDGPALHLARARARRRRCRCRSRARRTAARPSTRRSASSAGRSPAARSPAPPRATPPRPCGCSR